MVEPNAMCTMCAVCAVEAGSFEALGEHFVAEAAGSDVAHVMWLNRHVTKHRVEPAALAALLARQARGELTGEDQVKR